MQFRPILEGHWTFQTPKVALPKIQKSTQNGRSGVGSSGPTLVVVGTGPERIDCNNYWAGCVIEAYSPNHPDGGKGIWWKEANSEEERTAVKYDKLGLAVCRNVGRRVAEMAKVIKTGFDNLERKDTYWVRGGTGGFTGTGWGSKI